MVEVEHEPGDRSRHVELQHLRDELRCGQCADLEGAVAIEPAGHGSGERHVREHVYLFDRDLRCRCWTGDGGLLEVGAG